MRVIERDVVRTVVLDSNDLVLLFHTRDPTYPELGTWWELPGGGIDPGETVVDTAIRELAEETGITVEAAQVGAATWRRRATFRYRGARYINNEVVVPVRLSQAQPAVRGDARVGFEDENYFEYRWWSQSEIAEAPGQFYPGKLPKLLARFLKGEQIDEPYEEWS